MAHVFVSYVREDSAVVDRLCTVLRVSDVEVWLDRDRILPGQRWQEAIRSAISEGAFFIACFSKEYILKERTFMNEELTLAIEELRKRPVNRAWFIPVLLNPCDVPDRNIGGGESLNAIQRVSLFSDWEAGIQEILSVVAPHRANVYEIISRLRSQSARVRVAAADQLGTVGFMAAKESAAALIKALRDDHATVRGVAAESLGKIGIVSDEVIVALLRMENDDTRYGWGHAEDAFRAFGTAAVPILIKYLDSDRPRASMALRDLGNMARQSLPYLIARVPEGQNDFIVQALGAIGDRSALPCLFNAYAAVRDSLNLFDTCELVKAIATITHPGRTYWDQRDATNITEEHFKRWVEGEREL
jgi:hypothetical protein